MEIVDAQVHTWDLDSPRFPWHPTNRRLPTDTSKPMRCEDVLLAMSEVGVDAAVAVTRTLYGYNNGYALDAANRFPAKLAVAGRIDHRAADLGERLRAWREQPGMLCVRINVTKERSRQEWRRGDYALLFAAAERHAVPICVFPPRILADLVAVAGRHPSLRLVIDHLGLGGTPEEPYPGPDPFDELPQLLALSRFPNVAVKMTGVPSLSKEPYPFRDAWPHLRRVIDAFGPDRVMWGSDFTRVAPLHSYADGVNYLKEMALPAAEQERIFAGTVRRILGWPAMSIANSG